MKNIKRAFKETDKLFFLICLFLSGFGVVMVASATRSQLSSGQVLSRDATVMLLAVVLGAAASLIISFIDYDMILKLWPVVAGGSLLLMLLLIPFGVAPDARESARSWLKITDSLFFQPSEILKIGFIITFSYHLGRVKNSISSPKNVLLLCLHAAVPILLVVYTGDMGSALIFMLIFIGMMFAAGLHIIYFPIGLAAAAAAAPIVWFRLFDDIQRNRILALINPDDYPAEIYHQQQAANAIRQGGFFGTGLFQGPFTQTRSVPESENDMIFSVVCEELGFLGGVLLLAVFLLLAIKIISVGRKSNSFSAKMLCYGVMLMILSQVIINVGMCTMLLPVIGITLPFISAGGSSTVCLYIAVGLVMSVYRFSRGIDYDDYRFNRIAKSY